MAFLNAGALNKRLRILPCLIIIFLVLAHTLTVTAADADRDRFQSILQDSLLALWTGQEFGPALEQRQQTMINMLANGSMGETAFETMMEEVFLSIIDRQMTSRYILNVVPERFNALFSPHMEWPAAKKIVWRAVPTAMKANDPIVFTIASLAPPGTPWLNVPETMILPRIENLSGGKFLVKIYGGGVMGEDTDVLRKMGEDRLDSCGCTAVGLMEGSSDISVLMLPGLFNDYDEVDYICKKFRKTFDRAFEKNGYILGALIDTGNCYWFSVNKAVGLADIRKQNVAMWFGAMETAFYQELGINPITVAVPDTVAALSTGQINVNMSPAAWMLGMQAYQYSNFYIKPPILYSPGAVLIRSTLVDRIRSQLGVSRIYADNVMELFVSELNSFETEWNRRIRSYEEKSLKAFETKCGMKVLTFSSEDRQALEKAGKAVQQKLGGKLFPKDLLDRIQKALAEYRAQTD